MNYTITVSPNGHRNRTVIKISLDDDCRNGREDWSITADIYREGKWDGGGCCHERILSLRPDLADFVALHLCDFTGIPMHAMGNGFYWFAGWKGGLLEKYHGGSGRDGKTPAQCAAIFRDYFRLSDSDMAVFDACGAMTAEELQAVVEDLGLPARWRAESDAAITRLEGMTGQKFATASTKPGFQPLTPEVRALIAKRKASGYYTPEAIAERLRVDKEAKKRKVLEELEKDHAGKLRKLAKDNAVERWIVEEFGERFGSNLIWYSHTNELTCNWTPTEREWSKEDFAALEARTDKSRLPEGVRFVWKARGSR
jgi:hypothetical protein